MKSKQVLSIEQMKHLQELGVDASDASMIFQRGSATRHVWVLHVMGYADTSLREKEYTYTLQDILGLLPKEIKSGEDIFCLTMFVIGKMWTVCYSMSDEFDYYKEFSSVSLMDCAYDMLCWCIEMDILKGG